MQKDNIKADPDKIRGSLLGGAAGDALGYAVEFLGEAQIFSHYGPNGIQRYELDTVRKKALISDDTQMTLFTANGILVGETCTSLHGIGGEPMKYVPTSYQDWLCTQETDAEKRESLRSDGRRHISWLLDVPELFSRRAPGNTCLSALNAQKNGKTHGDIDNPPNHSSGCGGVMRVAPMGLKPSPYADIRTIDREGANLAAITHGHPLGYIPAAVQTHIINRIVYPEQQMTLKEITLEAIETAADLFAEKEPTDALISLLHLAVALSSDTADDLENIHRLGEGWTGDEALAIAVYCALRYEDDFSAGITAAVNHRGDSDSTGAITGNILGALHGFGAIDDRWKTDLELYDVILEMADDLCRGCMAGKHPDPDWERKYIHMRWKTGSV